MPVACTAAAASDPLLTDPERDAVKSVRQVFEQEIAASSRDPSDPTYREVWLKAQLLADDALAARLGQIRFDELRSRALSSAEDSAGQ
jgi:hypothetical protein